MSQSDDLPVVDPIKTAKSLGVAIYPLSALYDIGKSDESPIPVSEITSITTQFNGNPVIFVNTDYPQPIVRWCIAKELKHIIESAKRNDKKCSLNQCKLCVS